MAVRWSETVLLIIFAPPLLLKHLELFEFLGSFALWFLSIEPFDSEAAGPFSQSSSLRLHGQELNGVVFRGERPNAMKILRNDVLNLIPGRFPLMPFSFLSSLQESRINCIRIARKGN